MACTGRMAAAALAPGGTAIRQRPAFSPARRSYLPRRSPIQALGDQLEDLVTEECSSESSLKQPQKWSAMPYRLIAALSSGGAIETAYLTWIKLTGGSASCPAGAGSGCNDVLNSRYSILYGIPLSLVGFAAYASVALLSVSMVQTKSASFEEEARWLLLASTTSMAAASGYFIYLLNFKLEGVSCAYCLASAFLSFSLCLSSLKGFKWKDAPQMAGLQIGIVATVIVTLSSAFAGANSALAELDGLDLQPIESEVTTTSDATRISLAKYLKSIGAKMYGAFWCSHCYEQKQMLGKEAMKAVEYIECYPEGYRKGVSIAKVCEAAKIEGFPTWIIKGQAYSGELTLEELAEVSGYTLPPSTK